MIASYIKDFSSKYKELSEHDFEYNGATELITNDIPYEIFQNLKLNRLEYGVKGSVGKGAWAEIPWVAIMHRGITNTTRNGYYIVLLPTADMEHIFVTFALGWTQFKERYGTKNGLSKIASYAYALSKKLTLDDNDITETIDLGAKRPLGRGYEAGNICSRLFRVSELNDSELYDALEKYIGHYWLLINK